MARQNFIGLVVSQGKMQKTVKVRVETKVFNKRVNKELFHRKDYLVHDEGEISREGDMVRIESTRPISKHKFFAIAEIIKNSGQKFAEFENAAKLNVAKEEALKTKEFLDRRAQKLSSLSSSSTDVTVSNSTLLSDIKYLQKVLNNDGNESTNKDQESETRKLSEIKQKYGINDDFSKDTIRQLLSLDIIKMEKDLQLQKNNIDTVQIRIKEYMEDNLKAHEFLKNHGIESPELLQKNIMKNLLRKHLMHDLQL
ncbi:mitochondrial 37S ribosomal protein uS17m NDAI_0I01050 [Naumovozyma dairenensis CBS 421]|uniref:Uncharacterized protein n=1 Tax=Naumovozyma dairenensis (strain ATCC 10597 / BCRC 20456 / CBS 421 / NBRC 0211 / NRRL Y-12639) TaxID=1071378 RepID=G0WFW3_NAUDC|nr:hypothetical protein NDAI_0I01050 [Naumovozyma dairenensis CBS 421]CCD26674.1 hypothetical protein NDAI_0I01050 [Naumovozyma dairenensis CBS 421]